MLGNIASILNGTNKVISSSRIDWTNIKSGSLIRFNEDDLFYTILNSDKIFTVKNFETINQSVIKVKLSDDNSWIQIMPDDDAIISYKEYELSILLGIKECGKGYKVNDIVTLNEGVPVFSVSDGILNTTTLKILEVDNLGGIKKISLLRKGKYFTPPKEFTPLSGGSGDNAILEVDYLPIENRSRFETQISNVSNMGDHLIITLKRPLPQNLASGKMSIEKFEASLKEIYNGTSKINSLFTVSSDNTPNYKFPYMIKGALRPDTSFNYFLNSIDSLVKSLEERIIKLEKLNIPPRE